MDKINSTEKALEYLAMNPKGKIPELNIINDDLIQKFIESEVLTVFKEEYTFNQKGADFYCSEYKDNKELNFFGL